MVSWEHFELAFRHLSTQVPLEVFAFLGSFLEEIIPPIPAPLVMTTAGSLALAQHHGWPFLFWVAVTGAAGKLIASWVFYMAGDKLEDAVVRRFGRFLGVRHEDIEGIGRRFTGGWKDELVLFALRAIPLFPTVMVSIVCGIIRFNPATFLLATFLGTVVKNMLFLYAGYAGMHALASFAHQAHGVRTAVGLALAAGVIGFGWYWFSRVSGERKGVLWQRSEYSKEGNEKEGR
jgi:membrane protein DedA with SNARE-associated domain